MSDNEQEQDPKKLWRSEERNKRRQAKIDEAKQVADVYLGPSTVEEQEAQSDWQRLATTAQLKFPPHLAAKFNLSPNKRLAAVAHVLGWTIEKISAASGTHRNTISKWFNTDDNVKAFVEAFEFHTGSKDSKDLVAKEQYNSLEVLRELRDDPSVSASTRKEIAIWFFEAQNGKAKERKEITGVNLKDLTKQLKDTKGSEALIADLLDTELDGKSDKTTN